MTEVNMDNSGPEDEWSFDNINWTRSIKTALVDHQEEIPATTETVQGILDDGLYERLIGHKIAGFSIEGYDEPMGTWIVGLKLTDNLETERIAQLNALLDDRVGQVMVGRGEWACYFLVGSIPQANLKE